MLAALVPVAAPASIRISIAGPHTMKIGGPTSIISALAPSGNLRVTRNTCYSDSAPPTDITTKLHFGEDLTSAGSHIEIVLRPKSPGTCGITFTSYEESDFIQITVVK